MADSTKDGAHGGTFRPIIFVGAGSTGAKIVSRIQERLAQSDDPLIRTFVKYVNITSETKAEPGVVSAVPRRSLAAEYGSPSLAIGRLAEKISNQKQRAEFKEWWHQEKNGSNWMPSVSDVTDGAAGIRSVGRLLLHAKGSNDNPNEALIGNLRGFGQAIRSSWDNLPPHEKDRVEKNRILCFVFGLMAGGTCSGMILDLPLFLRQAWCVDENREEWFRVQLNGVFLLGDICYVGAAIGEQNWLQRNLQINNTRYTLAELFFTSTKTGRGICSPKWVTQIGREVFARELFGTANFYDSMTLIGAKNDADRFFRKFGAYLDFTADFYASLLESKTLNQQLARIVDVQGSHLPPLEQGSPSEPHNFSRIGRLGLRPPQEKSKLILQEKVADAVSKQFKNTDVSRDDELIDLFKSRTGCNSWGELLAPPEVTVMVPEPLPKKKDEFRQHWRDQKTAIEAHYSGFAAWPQDGVLSQSLVELVGQVKACLSDIAMNTLGQQAGKAFNLGSLSYFEKTLGGWMSERLSELTSRVATLQANISGKGEGGGNLTQQFQETLQRQTDDFPEDGLLNKFRRKTWSGNDDLAEALRQYTQSLRELRASEREIAVLRLAVAELQKIQIFTKLLGPACFETFKQIRALTAREFEEEKNRPEIWVEVLRDRESIERIIVEPLLSQTGENGETCLDQLTKQSLADWSSGAKSQLMATWNLVMRTAEAKKKLEQGGSVSLPSLEQMAQFPGLEDQFRAVAADLHRSIGGSIDKVVREKVSSMTVWDVLQSHVKELSKATGESADVLLQKLFSDYAQKATCFGKVSPKAPQVTPFRQEVVCIGVAEDAKRCFATLGIDQPDYLSGLLASAFGAAFSLTPPATAEGQREFTIFIFRYGGLPIYTEGFVDSVNLLLPQDGTGEVDWNWSDRRFPQWITEWWNQPSRPDYLNR